MKRIRSSLPYAASAVVACVLVFSPAGADAAEFHVPKDYTTIQAAISAATGSTSDTVIVEPNITPYSGTIIMKNNVSIRGSETARTYLTNNGTGPVVTIDGSISPISATIQNFTFVNASSGIQISSNSAAISIKNNVFQVGLGGTAITIQGSPSISVINNAFYLNGTALTSDSVTQIFNNIFASNSTDIVDPFISTNVANNAFPVNSNIVTGTTVTNLFVANPGFVNPSKLDFHLKEASPCIDTGNSSFGTDIIDGSACDIGAYGGPLADAFPFPVADLTIASSMGNSIDLTWSPNNCYLVTNATTTIGGYKVYYGDAPGAYNCTLASCGTSTSPIDVKLFTDFTLNNLATQSTPPSAPVLDQPSPRDGRLVLTWTGVSGATGYKVHYGIASLTENVPIDTLSTATSYELSGLTNGITYQVAVSAYSQRQYFIAVTAYDNTPTAHESAKSAEVSRAIGSITESGLSNVQSDFPEALTTYPALPNTGGRCFIATAAYGYYSAPEVQALRAFRDRYLLAFAPGRMFVEWYYRHGPAAAAFLNDHPGYKPVVRAALLPAVGAAIFLTGTSMMFKVGVFLVLGTAIAFGFFRKRLSRTGGLR